MTKITTKPILGAHRYPTAVEKRLATDLPANRSLIYQAYPQLQRALAQIPSKENERFEGMLSSAWIVQAERTKLSAYRASDVEKFVLRTLGYSPCEDQRSLFHAVLSSYKDLSCLPSVEALENDVPLDIQDQRLLHAGVEEKCLEQMQFLIDAMTDAQELLEKRSKKICAKKSLEAFPDWEFGRKKYQELLEDDSAFNIHWLVLCSLEENETKIQAILHQSDYESALEQLVMQDIVPSVDMVLCDLNPSKNSDNWLQWLQKYQPALQGSELIAEDPNERLGLGVCFGQCFNVALSRLKNALALPPLTIEPTDRFVQALSEAYIFPHRSLEQSHLPKSYLKRCAHERGKLEERVLWSIDKSPDQDAMIKMCLEDSLLYESKKVLVVVRRRHAICLRFDQKRGIHYLFDPNLGTLHFMLENGETHEQLAERMAQAYIELYHTAYPIADDDNERCYAFHWIPA